MQLLREKLPEADKELIRALFGKRWVVYAKRPFAGPGHVVEYLGRYTHKIAISNHRIKEVGEQSVSFSYRDYRQGAKKLEMKLEGMEFIRRFALHILPRGFVRIRHYGILSGTSKGAAIPVIREQLPGEKRREVEVRDLEEYNPLLCPCCKKETMLTLQVLAKRGPPQGMRTQHRYREFE